MTHFDWNLHTRIYSDSKMDKSPPLLLFILGKVFTPLESILLWFFKCLSADANNCDDLFRCLGWSLESFAYRIRRKRTRALEYYIWWKILFIIIQWNSEDYYLHSIWKDRRRHYFTCHKNNTNSLLWVVGSRAEESWYSSIPSPSEFWLMGTLIEFAKWNINNNNNNNHPRAIHR